MHWGWRKTQVIDFIRELDKLPFFLQISDLKLLQNQ